MQLYNMSYKHNNKVKLCSASITKKTTINLFSIDGGKKFNLIIINLFPFEIISVGF
jgi:hypothetical protein